MRSTSTALTPGRDRRERGGREGGGRKKGYIGREREGGGREREGDEGGESLQLGYYIEESFNTLTTIRVRTRSRKPLQALV